IYIYLDPKKQGKYKYNKYKFLHEPIYVGKGKGKRAYYYKHKNNNHLKNKLARMGQPPIILIIAKKLLENRAFELEKELISLIGRIDLKTGPLCNFTDGGEGVSGAIVSEETKIKLSESH